MGPLGLRKPKDREHLARYPLSTVSLPAPVKAMVMGVNWYTNFDRPEKIGNIYVIGRGDLGSIRGGHCTCLKAPSTTDPLSWWDYYDQGQEGSCVGFGSSRMISEFNRKRYDALWLYHRAQELDEFSDTPPEEGTTVRAALSVLKNEGAIVYNARWKSDVTYGPQLEEGISAYRWATDWQEVRDALGVPASAHSVPMLNNWGRSYPHIVHITDEAGSRVLREEGEFGVPTDR